MESVSTVVLVIVVATVAAVVTFAWFRLRKRAADVNAASLRAEAAFLAENGALETRSPAAVDPDRAARMRAVAAAFGGQPYLPDSQGTDSAAVPVPVEEFADLLVPDVGSSPSEVTDAVLDEIAAALRAIASDVEVLTRSGEDADVRAARAVDVVLAGLARLPLSRLVRAQG
jgi:hypothetical protein